MWGGGSGHAVGQGEVGFWHMCFQSVSSHARPLGERGYPGSRWRRGKAQHEKHTKELPFFANTDGIAFFTWFLECCAFFFGLNKERGSGQEEWLKLSKLSCTTTAF